ncbi:uncharacterized protein LOC128306452 [Anopheles moucheti]|uniref:uncharacterized protein LOC128306452 n=1 Tax=Anopheles moucheti TaxID=186751 RepID=UPI0022F084B0|nr:uncharacterized protein LOC128306452 [Anopheles moucheti]
MHRSVEYWQEFIFSFVVFQLNLINDLEFQLKLTLNYFEISAKNIHNDALPKLPAIIFGTDDIAVQMSVFLAITGMVTYASLLMIQLVGRAARHSLMLVLEQVFLASFGLFLTITGIIVHMMVEDMELAYRVLSISILVSHSILALLLLIAKVKQMNRVADRESTTSNQVDRVRSFRRSPPSNNGIMEVSRNDRYTYRFVNPGSNTGNEVMIPPNVRYASMFEPRDPSYSEPYRAIRTSDPISSNSSHAAEAQPEQVSNGVSITELSLSMPSSSRQTSGETSELSACTTRPTTIKPFRVNPTTFRRATLSVDSSTGLLNEEESKPPPLPKRPISFNSDAEPMPSTSRQNMPSISRTRSNRQSEPIPSTSRQSTTEPTVSYKSGDDYGKQYQESKTLHCTLD